MRNADVVIRAIYGDIDAKQALCADRTADEGRPRCSPATPQHPSGATGIKAGAAGRLVGLHGLLQSRGPMPLLVVTTRTRQQWSAAQLFACVIDKLPLKVRSSPGFLVSPG